MRARVRGKKTWFYYDHGGRPRKETPLGLDFAIAIKKWAELELADQVQSVAVATFDYAAERYNREVTVQKARSTQRNNNLYLPRLRAFFADAPLEQIAPIHIRQYLDWRVREARKEAELRNAKRREKNIEVAPVPTDIGKVIANREIALFSAIWNQARDWGYTDKANPCLGVKKHRERGRDIYVEDQIYIAVYNAADQPLRDAMDLAYLTGQRPGDTLSMSESDLRDGALHIQQAKTGTKLRISVIGELEAVIGRIRHRKHLLSARTLQLVVNEKAQCLGKDALRSRFDRARVIAADNHPDLAVAIRAFQFRDLRAKAGTDKTESSGDIREAQKQLGHGSITMTEHYVRNRKGDLAKPTK